jgi:hypothetical protein
MDRVATKGRTRVNGKLVAEGFDLTARIHVQELPYGQGFHVTQ